LVRGFALFDHFLDRCLGALFVKDRARRRIDMVAASLAGERAPLRHGMKFGSLRTAFQTVEFGPAVVDLHELGHPCLREFG
jgi:hypothetical protein